MTKQSGSLRYLKGKRYPDADGAKIVDIKAPSEKKRVIVLAGNTSVEVSKQKLKNFLIRTMAAEQKSAMLKTLRKTPNGHNITIGGHVNGERRTYKTRAAAKAAVTRHYGK